MIAELPSAVDSPVVPTWATLSYETAQGQELLSQICRREGVQAFFAGLCNAGFASARLVIGNGEPILVAGTVLGDSGGLLATATKQIVFQHQAVALVTVNGSSARADALADMIALWLEDLLAREAEVGSLTYEIVHSYEELHVLYALAGKLNGTLDVEAACRVVVQQLLEPLSAAHVVLRLYDAGKSQVVADLTAVRPLGAGGNPTAQASAPLQVNGEIIGILLLEGKLVGHDFTSSDLKLLQGIAAVAAPAIRTAQLYAQVREQADTDGLTGIANHRRLQERTEEELKRAQRYEHGLSLIQVDIDNFKLFNDVYGHPVGDRVLQIIAECLRDTARGTDTVGRYGGDEFMLILPETDQHGAAELAERLLAHVACREIVIEGERLPLSISVGIATFPDDATTKHQLIAHADTAMYESKAAGGHTFRTAHLPRTDWLKIQSTTFGVLEGLVRSVDNKDHYTREHSEVVTEAALLLAQQLQLGEETRRALRIAGLLHDVGKIGIPDHVLKKPGKLTADEYAIMQQHVQLSETMIKNVPYLSDVLDAVAHHHERYDGTGYPYGKRQDDIPLLGRIMAVADAYSAMIMDRPYRKGLDWAATRAQLQGGAGTQFDPTLVPIFIAAIETCQPPELAFKTPLPKPTMRAYHRNTPDAIV